jgi:tRNA modification GTPase
VVFVHDLSRRGDPGYEAAEAAIAARLPATLVVDVDNKADVAPAGAVATTGGVRLSARTGEGLEALRAELLRRAGWQPGGEGVSIARERHLGALAAAASHVATARAHAAAGDRALELVAEELRLAHEALGAITGEFGVEDLLGEIFGRFCIGK